MDNRKQEYFDFLDALRLSAVTNMFGATPYLIEEFPELNKKGAREILKEWMDSFNKD